MTILHFPAGVYVVDGDLEAIGVVPPFDPPPTAVGADEPDERVINVRDYGAAGDGVTDDTAAINRAISALNR